MRQETKATVSGFYGGFFEKKDRATYIMKAEFLLVR